jgi:hypothetical protein
LDVCIRRPVEMADVAELRQAAHADTEAEAQDRKLRDAVRMVAHITPRTGREDDALEHLARRARAALRD